MIDTEPILTLPAFVAMFIASLMIIAGIAEYIVHRQNKGSHDAPTSHEQGKTYNNKYYITKRKAN